MGLKKGRQVPGNRVVRSIGQSEFLEAGTSFRGLFIELHSRHETVDEKFTNFFSRHFSFLRAANETSASARQVNGEPVRSIRTEKRFLYLLAAADEHAPGPSLEFAAGDQPLLDKMREGHVQVVASQDQVL